MIYIEKHSTDPWFNLAAEEVALKSTSEDILMLWVNKPSVVLGKHQNTVAEINQAFVIEHDIPVIRRISGGGTVYHDLGNLNYSLITSSENREKLIDFPKFADPVVQFLKTFGYDVKFYGKTNLGVNGQKFSGNAAHVFKNRVLHHGTLLFDTDLNRLEQTIRPTEANVKDKAIKSVRADLINLNSLLPQISSINEFQQLFKSFLVNYFSITKTSVFTAMELEEINLLVNEKYKTTQWNYGYSPNYLFTKAGLFQNNEVVIHLDVKKGIIVDLQLESTVLPESITQLIQQTLTHLPHNPQAMKNALQPLHSALEVIGMEISFLLNLLI